MSNLFTYGSLMCADIMYQVSGQQPIHQAAYLDDYFCSQMHDETYPGIAPSDGNRVKGVLYLNLDHLALSRLDSFEGEYYERKEVSVLTESCGQVLAMAYIIKPQFRHLMTGTPWNYEQFLHTGKRQFEMNYLGFTRI
ncbi:gamma-glutamylcyclotransferase family protein [Desulforhopalus sp. IMCC35007]|uniref:gamma-glutamylcyclotransferase family protein n=1 Tax=Desulforhopalus sp. IMCC35007 TaxID=2569543 RepID=UPI00210FCC21|nr:gamma-glutamylcyclotransferase family protein [Desulforhopalus sp. IMCC35007]